MEALCQWLAAHGSSCLELVAVLFGIAGVWLSVLERVSNWPVGMINVALYTLLFVRQKFYANAALQIVYFALSAYGWYEWLYGGERRTALTVTRASRRVWIGVTVAMVATWAVLVAATRMLGGAMPYLDAGTVAVSLVAEWMLARKLLENWAVWIGVDAVYVGMLITAHLYLTAVNYAVYFALAVWGHVAWKRSLQAT